MVLIIRSIESNDLNRGFNDLYDEKLNEESFNRLINKYSKSFILYNTKLDIIHGIILSNTIKILEHNIFYYSIYSDKIKNFKILLDHFVKETNGIYFLRTLCNFDIEDIKFVTFVGDNLEQIKEYITNTFILHSPNDYISVKTINKFKFTGKNLKALSIVSDILYINSNNTMDLIFDILHPTQIRLLHKNDVNNGLGQLFNQLGYNNNNNQLNEYKYRDFIHKMINEFGNIAKVYVIRHLNKLIGTGTIYFQPKIHRSAENIEYGAFIEDIIIDKSYRDLGLGNFFINFLIDKCKNSDIDLLKKYKIYKISLNCSDKLCPFYQKSKFIKSGNQMTIYL